MANIISTVVVVITLGRLTRIKHALLFHVWVTIAQAKVTVMTIQRVVVLTNASTKGALDVPTIKIVIQVKSVARKRFFSTKLFALRTVSTKDAIPMMIVLVEGNVVDQASVQTQAVVMRVNRNLNVIWINIVVKRKKTIGEMAVLKIVSAKFAAQKRTVELKMLAVFLINVLIVDVRDVPSTPTVVQASIVVRKGIRTN